MKPKISLLLAFLLVALLYSCENDEQQAPLNLQISISPDSLFIKDTDTAKMVYISTKPKWKCSYKITQKPSWLVISPEEGIIDGKVIPVKITPVKTGLTAGSYRGEISIISDIAGAIEVDVFMTVAEHPMIKVNTASISFPENVTESDLTFQNTGNGTLIWSLSSPSWLSFSVSSGTLAAGATKSVKVTCRRTGMDVNTYSGGITITSNSEVSVTPIPVSMVVPAFRAIEVTANILFHELSEKQNIVLKNAGNTQLSWNATCGNYLTLGTTSGIIEKGATQTIEVTVNRSSFQTGNYESSVTINYGEAAPKAIPVTIKNFISTKLGIEGIVKDAEFCSSTNRIIIVTTNPDRLLIIDPDTKTIEPVLLHAVPRCVSVNKGGDKAVVGHNGMITYVSLTGKTIEKESTVSCDVLDLVLTSTNWVYAFPVRDQWTRIVCVSPTGVSTLHTGNSIYAGTVGKLHPSEKWIYGADNGISPSDIEKYNIENGTAVFNYDSPYHGDYYMNGNLWFSETGDRIFTRGRTILRATADAATDMVYNGSIPGTNDIWSLFHSGTTDKVFYIPFTRNTNWEVIAASEVSVCSYSYLTYQKNYPLEKFIVPDNTYGTRLVNSEGQFVFANKEGTMLYVVVKANKSSGLLNEWALQNININ